MARPVVLCAIVALFVLQGCTTAKPVEKSQLEVLVDNAKTLADNVTATLGIQDLSSKKIVKALNEQTQVLADSLETAAGKLKAEVSAHEGDLKKVTKQVEEEFAKTAETLKKLMGPDATAKAAELRNKFDEGYKNAAAELEKLVKSVRPQAEEAQTNIKNLAKTTLDQILEIGRKMQAQINSAITDHEKTHTN